jgi:hypothetical protein
MFLRHVLVSVSLFSLLLGVSTAQDVDLSIQSQSDDFDYDTYTRQG